MMPAGPQAMTADAGPSAGGQATIMWAGSQIAVDSGQGPQPVDDIGAALQMVLDAYREASEGQPGEAAFAAAFSRDEKPADRQPTARDSAAAGRY
jgi:hypothetical protein